MLKIRSFLLATMFLLPISSAFGGEDAVVSLFDGTSEASYSKTSSASNEEDDGGILSFLDFKLPDKFIPSFIQQPDEANTIEDAIKLADSGNLKAQLFLGYSYLYGENGLKPDYDKAFEYYGKAALQNDATGLNNLGSLYYNGIGVKRNPAKAAILFAKATELGNAEAAVNLGFMLISGNSSAQDKAKALDCFEKAASAGNTIANFMTGYAYYTGILRPLDYNKAGALIKIAADAGLDEAQLVLAEAYMKGRGFPQNYNNVVKYLRLAASQGNTDAMMILGDILFSGEKYNKDIEFAHVLYNLASVRGVTQAAAKRQEVESKMKIKEVLQAQSRAETFTEEPSALTKYVHQTFGSNVRGFITDNY